MKGKYFLRIFIVIIIVIITGFMMFYVSKKDKSDEVNTSNTIAVEENANDYFILYKGNEIKKEIGLQDVSDMKLNDENLKKYNISYFNYEDGKYNGKTTGRFGEETYEGYSNVSDVSKIAISKEYDAVPRKFETINELPEELIDMADYSSTNIETIDLDGDDLNEYIVCYTVNYAEGEIGDGSPQASSGIMLFDNNYKKIADLVTLENGFWSDIKEEEYKIFLSLDDVDYIDIDNDKIMEIIVQVPTYEGVKLSIIKYNNGTVQGESNLKANVIYN